MKPTPPAPRPADAAAAPIFLTAEWRRLVMANFAADPAWLARFVPAGTELDFFRGQTFISVVGFLFRRTRVRGWAVPFHRHFPEVNLRFYVRRKTADGDRRGVVFLREIVPRRAIAWAARKFYNENYAARPMRHRLTGRAGETGAAEYAWRHAGRWHSLAAQWQGAPALPAPGSLAEFIAEHYWGYGKQRDGGTLEYRVEHEPWTVWEADSHQFDCDVAAVYGAEFAAILRRPPVSVLVADGSPVIVRQGVRLPIPK